MSCYAHEAREEQKYGSDQDHSPTVVPATDCGELCNCGLFIFPSAVWLGIIILLYVYPSLSSRTKEELDSLVHFLSKISLFLVRIFSWCLQVRTLECGDQFGLRFEDLVKGCLCQALPS